MTSQVFSSRGDSVITANGINHDLHNVSLLSGTAFITQLSNLKSFDVPPKAHHFLQTAGSLPYLDVK